LTWRILVGEDAKTLDAAVRAKPEAAYGRTERSVSTGAFAVSRIGSLTVGNLASG
jgi:hypothetical protein